MASSTAAGALGRATGFGALPALGEQAFSTTGSRTAHQGARLFPWMRGFGRLIFIRSFAKPNSAVNGRCDLATPLIVPAWLSVTGPTPFATIQQSELPAGNWTCACVAARVVGFVLAALKRWKVELRLQHSQEITR